MDAVVQGDEHYPFSNPGPPTQGGRCMCPLGALVRAADVKSILLGVVLRLCRTLPEAIIRQVVSYCRDQHEGTELLSCILCRGLPVAPMTLLEHRWSMIQSCNCCRGPAAEPMTRGVSYSSDQHWGSEVLLYSPYMSVSVATTTRE